MVEAAGTEKKLLARKLFVLSERYELGEVIGSGGMGKVYRAVDRETGQVIALKILHDQIASDAQQAKRFEREVQLALRVQHINIVRLLESGVDAAGVHYLIMEYVEGVTLKTRVEAGPIPWRIAVNYLIQICEGLDALHNLGIIHRDLKPSNIMITPGDVIKITDFGVARERSSDLTRTNEIVGSIAYMSPELWKGNEEGAPTMSVDLYALGVMAYELVTGILPFDGDVPAELMWKHLEALPTPPRDLVPAIPRWLNQIILKLLEKKLYDRPPNAEVVKNLLEEGTNLGDDGWVDLPIRSGTDAGYIPSVTGPIMPASTLPSWEDDARQRQQLKQPRALWDHSAVQLRPHAVPRAMLEVVRRLVFNFGAAGMIAWVLSSVVLGGVTWLWNDLNTSSSLGFVLNSIVVAGVVGALIFALPILFLAVVRHSLKRACQFWLKAGTQILCIGAILLFFNIWRIDTRQSSAEGSFHRSWFIGAEVAAARNVFEATHLTPRGTYVTVGFNGVQPVWRPQAAWSWKAALALYGAWIAVLLVVTNSLHRDIFQGAEILSWYGWLGITAGPGILWAIFEPILKDEGLRQRILFNFGPIPLSVDRYGIFCGFTSWMILFVVVAFITWRQRERPQRPRKFTMSGSLQRPKPERPLL